VKMNRMAEFERLGRSACLGSANPFAEFVEI
jgi:hypothetical protein